jgi:hypothetical protein
LHFIDLGLLSYLKYWHLHEIIVILLSELIFINIKLKSMKETIIKISIHLIISGLLINLECLIIQIGGQGLQLGRPSNKN